MVGHVHEYLCMATLCLVRIPRHTLKDFPSLSKLSSANFMLPFLYSLDELLIVSAAEQPANLCKFRCGKCDLWCIITFSFLDMSELLGCIYVFEIASESLKNSRFIEL
jgi:hypothetical protein